MRHEIDDELSARLPVAARWIMWVLPLCVAITPMVMTRSGNRSELLLLLSAPISIFLFGISLVMLATALSMAWYSRALRPDDPDVRKFRLAVLSHGIACVIATTLLAAYMIWLRQGS